MDRARASELLLAYAAAFFGGTLALAVLAPIVALYEHSSAFFGQYAAIGSVVVGFAVAVVVLVRTLRRFAGDMAPRAAQWLPVISLVVLQGAALAQLSSSITPIFDRRTPFGHGIDALAPAKPEAHDDSNEKGTSADTSDQLR